jgi:hypothetical protein
MTKLTQSAGLQNMTHARPLILMAHEGNMEKVPILSKTSKRDLAINNFMC